MVKRNRNPLKGQEAIDLWLKGKDAWNHEVMLRPNFDVDFSNVDFAQHVDSPNGQVDFSGFYFPNGKVDFSGAQFGDGGVCFTKADFGDGDVSFLKAVFGAGKVRFLMTVFGGGAFFTDLVGVENVKLFSFKGAVFNGLFSISSEEEFPCLIDLTYTKTSRHVLLDGFKCTLPRKKSRTSFFFSKGDWATQKVAKDSKNIALARRLKELAEANKDHQAAQDFHVLEMQAKRVHSKCPIGYLWNTEFWYEKLSDYGRSITQPLLWMAYIWWAWTIAYMTVSFVVTDKAQFVKNAVYSVAQMLAFIPSSRDARFHLGEALFGTTPPDLIYALTFSQSILALILLFLLGLGLRHRYRI